MEEILIPPASGMSSWEEEVRVFFNGQYLEITNEELPKRRADGKFETEENQ